MAAKSTPQSNSARIKELDALFQRGGLTRSPHKRPTRAQNSAAKKKTIASAAKKQSTPAAAAPKKPPSKALGPDIL
ncbi:MAG: hypothetical protein WA430_11005, partial [Acidobacteriaceae bacterium]